MLTIEEVVERHDHGPEHSALSARAVSARAWSPMGLVSARPPSWQ